MKTIEEKAKELYPEETIIPMVDINGNPFETSVSVDNWINQKRDAYIKGYEEGKAEANAEWQEKTRWIPVEEKLPEKDKTVLCKIKLFNSMSIYYGICLFLSKNEWINMGNTSYSNFETSVSKVTHWREIIG